MALPLSFFALLCSRGWWVAPAGPRAPPFGFGPAWLWCETAAFLSCERNVDKEDGKQNASQVMTEQQTAITVKTLKSYIPLQTPGKVLFHCTGSSHLYASAGSVVLAVRALLTALPPRTGCVHCPVGTVESPTGNHTGAPT